MPEPLTHGISETPNTNRTLREGEDRASGSNVPLNQSHNEADKKKNFWRFLRMPENASTMKKVGVWCMRILAVLILMSILNIFAHMLFSSILGGLPGVNEKAIASLGKVVSLIAAGGIVASQVTDKKKNEANTEERSEAIDSTANNRSTLQSNSAQRTPDKSNKIARIREKYKENREIVELCDQFDRVATKIVAKQPMITEMEDEIKGIRNQIIEIENDIKKITDNSPTVSSSVIDDYKEMCKTLSEDMNVKRRYVNEDKTELGKLEIEKRRIVQDIVKKINEIKTTSTTAGGANIDHQEILVTPQRGGQNDNETVIGRVDSTLSDSTNFIEVNPFSSLSYDNGLPKYDNYDSSGRWDGKDDGIDDTIKDLNRKNSKKSFSAFQNDGVGNGEPGTSHNTDNRRAKSPLVANGSGLHPGV